MLVVLNMNEVLFSLGREWIGSVDLSPPLWSRDLFSLSPRGVDFAPEERTSVSVTCGVAESHMWEGCEAETLGS